MIAYLLLLNIYQQTEFRESSFRKIGINLVRVPLEKLKKSFFYVFLVFQSLPVKPCSGRKRILSCIGGVHLMSSMPDKFSKSPIP